MSYSRHIKSGSRRRERKREVFLVRSGLIVLLLLFVLFGLIYLSRLAKFQINQITIEGNSVTSESDIKEIINENISGLYFKMFPKKNSLIYPKNRLEGVLMEEFRRISNVKLSVKDFQRLHIIITERKPDSLWCGTDMGLEYEECYFVDYNGLIYSKAPNFSGNVFLRTYGTVGNSNPINSHYLAVSEYKNLFFLKNILESYEREVVSAVKLESRDMEIWFADDSKLIYNLDQDVLKLSDDIVSIFKSNEFKESLLNEGALDYVDMRFGNKVYYKFK